MDVHILASSFLFWADFSDQLQRINVGQVAGLQNLDPKEKL